MSNPAHENGSETRPKHPPEDRPDGNLAMSARPTMVNAHLCRPSLFCQVRFVSFRPTPAELQKRLAGVAGQGCAKRCLRAQKVVRRLMCFVVLVG